MTDDGRRRRGSGRARGTGSGTGDAWRVIVLNDNHNTFEGVAFALAQTIPGVDYDTGMRLANKIHYDRPGGRLVGPPRARRALPLASSRATA